MFVSIVIPVYNNESVLPGVLSILRRSGPAWPFRAEVVFVDDASCDSTPQIAERAVDDFPIPLRILYLRDNGGQAQALLHGLREAQGEIALTFPADMVENLSDIPRIVEHFSAHNAAVMRIVRTERKYPSGFRKAASLAFNALLRRLGVGLKDAGSSLYICRRSFYTEICRPEYAHFYAALPVLVFKLAGRVPVFGIADRSEGPTTFSFRKLVRFGWTMLRAALTPLPRSRAGRFAQQL